MTSFLTTVKYWITILKLIGTKSELIKLDQSQLMPYCKLFIDLTANIGRFPTLDEYSNYTLQMKKYSGNKIRLFTPQNSSEIQKYFDMYSRLGVEVGKFIERTNASIAVLQRVKMEKRLYGKDVVQFINDAKELLVQRAS